MAQSRTVAIEVSPDAPGMETALGLLIAVGPRIDENTVQFFIDPAVLDFQEASPTPPGVEVRQATLLGLSDASSALVLRTGQRRFLVREAAYGITLLRIDEVESVEGRKRRFELRVERFESDELRAEGVPPDLQVLALYRSGLLKKQHGDEDGALGDFSAALDVEDGAPETQAEALNQRALMRTRRGDHAGAAEDLDRAIAVDEVSDAFKAQLRVNRAIARGRRGNVEGAREDLEAAIGAPEASADQKERAQRILDKMALEE